MTIEAYVSARQQGERGLKKQGDILCVKLAGSPWGREEKGGVVQWTDAVLEAKLQAMQDAGEPNPVIVHPYSEYEVINKGQPTEQTVMVNRSKSFVDFDDLTKAAKDRLASRGVDTAPLSEREITTKTRTKETRGGDPKPNDNPTPPPRTRTR